MLIRMHENSLTFNCQCIQMLGTSGQIEQYIQILGKNMDSWDSF